MYTCLGRQKILSWEIKSHISLRYMFIYKSNIMGWSVHISGLAMFLYERFHCTVYTLDLNETFQLRLLDNRLPFLL
jgi:hypothetical protein